MTEEDFRLYTTVGVNGVDVDRVLCKVYLPVKHTDSIKLRFYPTEEQAGQMHYWKFSVRGVVKGHSGGVVARIRAEKVYQERQETKLWSEDLSETITFAEASDFEVTRFWAAKPKPDSDSEIEGKFWLTPSTLLRPARAFKNYPDGRVEVSTPRQFAFTLPSGTSLTFDHHYHRRENEQGETITFEELVAIFNLQGNVGDGKKIEELLDNDLEDVLLLASFAARHSCVCVGWEAADSYSYTQRYVGNRTIPAEKDKARHRDEIIELSDFPAFMAEAYRRFTGMVPNESLRRAIHFAIPSEGHTVDSDFVNLYSALEMMVLHFRREQGLEFILPDEGEFRRLQGDLRKWLKQHPLLEDKGRRGLVYEKLFEINRVSFGHAFEKFCEVYSVDLGDLWPVVGNVGGPSLSTIRNRLVHGEVLGEGYYKALITAKFHLQWTVERMILAMLGWPVKKSNIDEWYLSPMAMYKDWDSERANLFR
jgi:hypothetical protein